MTPSLQNFLLSLVAGGFVVGAIFVALFIFSQRDKVRRR